MPHRRRFLALTTALALASAAFWAWPRPAPAPDWPAVGRITLGGPLGQATCTGTLIAADLVLTAGHCAAGFAGAAPDRLADLGFAAGLSDGAYLAYGTAAEVRIPPGHTPGPLTAQTIPQDIALIRLSTPLHQIPPIPVSPLMAFDSRVGFVAYANAAPRAPIHTSDCAIAERGPGLLQIGCPVVSGHSGAAALAGLPDAPRVVGVISATSPVGAFAAAIPPWLLRQLP